MMRLPFFILALLALSSRVFGSESIWNRLDQLPAQAKARNVVRPQAFQVFQLNPDALKRALGRVPKEAVAFHFANASEISLPMPDGATARFKVVEAPIMEPELAAKFPELKTYLGQGIDDPTATVRFDSTPAGVHAQILSPKGAVYIDPAIAGDAISHLAYFKRDYRQAVDGFKCLVEAQEQPPAVAPKIATLTLASSGSSLRTYRLACAATGEYTQFHGGTVSAGMAAIVTAINRVVGVYEKELAVRLVLVANNNLIVYTNAATDPYSNTNESSMLTQNQTNLDSVIQSGNYDIGHVFGTGGGGLAWLGVVCEQGGKARGVTGLPSPIGDPFYIDFVAHEIGHQFGASHTFNGKNGLCFGNRDSFWAYEPGSGSTIMAYAGTCGSDDLQPHSDPYFHSGSFDQIIAFITTDSGSGCAVITPTGNTAPSVNAGNNYTIPQSTPFTLTATGSDPNGDALTFCWEERDKGAAQTVTEPDNGNSPLFRSFSPTTSPARTFPKLSSILNNSSSLGERLPTTNRVLNFRVTARDNRPGGGGVNADDMQVTVDRWSGPFQVTSPLQSEVWSNAQNVMWDVANTVNPPVNAANVNILLSTNGGQTFSVVLATNTPNDGFETINLPNQQVSAARIKVEAAGNIFFDISDSFSLSAFVPPAPLLIIESATVVAESCSPGNGLIDPGETVTVSLTLRNIGNADATNVTASLVANGNIHSPTGPENYGQIPVEWSITRDFTFLANGICGEGFTANLVVDDAGHSLGTLSQALYFGAGLAAGNFTNVTSLDIPFTSTQGETFPYPSIITVSNMAGPINKVTVNLHQVTHEYPDDIDILLVGPNGEHVVLMADAGGRENITNVTLTFDDAAGALPDESLLLSGTYHPGFYEIPDDFSAPAPPPPHGTNLSVFNGINANGDWSLYIYDDSLSDTGTVTNWSVSIRTTPSLCCGELPPQPVLSGSADVSGGSFTITWDSIPGRNYEVQFKNSLNDLDWMTLVTVTASDGTTAIVDNLGAKERYYRIVVLP